MNEGSNAGFYLTKLQSTEDLPEMPFEKNRFLDEDKDPFSHNSWDGVKMDDEAIAAAESIISTQSTQPHSNPQDLLANPSKKWNTFYTNHEAGFFKERHWFSTEFPELMAPNISILECGCGTGSSLFPLAEANPTAILQGCDFSQRAIQVLQKHAGSERINAFVHDLTVPLPLEEASVDFALLIFVLSAVPPEKHVTVLQNISKVLKPGGVILYRDCGQYDLAQLRLPAKRFIQPGLYARGDGTLVYFSSLPQLQQTAAEAGLQVLSCESDQRLLVNRGKRLTMHRIWHQAKAKTSHLSIHHLPMNSNASNGKSSVPALTTESVNMILEENRALLRACIEFQKAGRLGDVVEFQKRLHQNLMLLTSAASNQRQQSVNKPNTGIPVQCVKHSMATGTLMETLQWWQAGNLPSNKQLSEWLVFFKKHPLVQSTSAYSPATRTLFDDINSLVDCLLRILNEKNHDELIQDIGYHFTMALKVAFTDFYNLFAQKVPIGTTGDGKQHWFLATENPNFPSNWNSFQQDMLSAFAAVRFLLLSTGELRHCAADLNEILSILLQVRITPTGPEKATPSAKTNQPFPSASPPSEFLHKPPPSKEHQATTHQEETRSFSPTNAEEFEMSLPEEALFSEPEVDSDWNEKLRMCGGAAASTATEVTRKPTYMLEPQTESERLRNAIKRLAYRISDTPQLEKHTKNLMSFFQRISTSSQQMVPGEVRRDANSKQLLQDISNLFARFSSSAQISRLQSAIRNLSFQLGRESNLRAVFEDWQSTLNSAIADPLSVDTLVFQERLQTMLRAADEQVRGTKFGESLTEAVDAWSKISLALSNDVLAQEFGRKVTRVSLAPWISREVLGDLRNYIVPNFIRGLGSIPSPEVICTDETRGSELKLRGIVLALGDWFPSLVEMRSSAALAMRTRGSGSTPTSTTSIGTRIVLQGMNIVIPDIQFQYKEPKKRESSGFVDVKCMGKRGFVIVIELEGGTDSLLRMDSQNPIKVRTVRARLHGLRFKFHGTGRDFRYSLIGMFMRWRLRPQIERAIEERLKKLIEEANQRAGTLGKMFSLGG